MPESNNHLPGAGGPRGSCYPDLPSGAGHSQTNRLADVTLALANWLRRRYGPADSLFIIPGAQPPVLVHRRPNISTVRPEIVLGEAWLAREFPVQWAVMRFHRSDLLWVTEEDIARKEAQCRST